MDIQTKVRGGEMEINQNEERFKDEVKMLEDLRGGIN